MNNNNSNQNFIKLSNIYITLSKYERIITIKDKMISIYEENTPLPSNKTITFNVKDLNKKNLSIKFYIDNSCNGTYYMFKKIKLDVMDEIKKTGNLDFTFSIENMTFVDPILRKDIVYPKIFIYFNKK